MPRNESAMKDKEEISEQSLREQTESMKLLPPGFQDRDELFRSITETAIDAIISIDKDDTILLWNCAAETMFGYSSHEAIGKQLTMIIPEHHRQSHKKGIRRLCLTGKSRIVGMNYEVTALRKDGEEFPVELSLSSWTNRGETFFTGIIRDITKRKRLEKQLRDTSITDELTGLLNRRGFLTFSEKQCEISKRHKRNFAILFLDLNDMKTINDKFGHKAGDQALIDVAHILKKTFRSSDIIARIGGDEFTVLITESRHPDFEKTVTRNILINLGKHNEQKGRSYQLSVSTGIANFDPENPCSIDDLLMRADALMYKNKKNKGEDTTVALTGKSETRRNKRIDVPRDFTAELILSDDVRIKNISLRGICLKTSRQLAKNNMYRIKMLSPDNREITPMGVVMWSSLAMKGPDSDSSLPHYEAGLKFIKLNKTLVSSLKQFISNLT